MSNVIMFIIIINNINSCKSVSPQGQIQHQVSLTKVIYYTYSNTATDIHSNSNCKTQ